MMTMIALPGLRARGVTEEAIRAITVTNPMHWLVGGDPATDPLPH